jgi:hypothetical protein
MVDPVWRKSSFSDNGKCVEVADTGARALIRNSNHPDRGTLEVAPAAMAAFVEACHGGELDDLA